MILNALKLFILIDFCKSVFLKELRQRDTGTERKGGAHRFTGCCMRDAKTSVNYFFGTVRMKDGECS